MDRRQIILVCLMPGLLAIGGTAVAQDSSEENPEEHAEAAQHTESAGHEEYTAGEHEPYRNSLGVFLGVTDEPGHDAEGTSGIEYTRVFDGKWGIGALAEHAGGDLRNTVLIAFGLWRPWKGLEFVAGPGVEYHDGRSSGESHEKSSGEDGTDNNETYFILRVGAGWHIHLSHRVGLVPAVYLDLVEGEKVWVYGVNVTYGF